MTLPYEPVVPPPSPSSKRETLVMAALCCAVAALAVFAVSRGLASWLEAVSFVTGAVCVWLTVKENVWNFPIGLLNVATFSVVFFRVHLYADAGLQVVYFVLGVIGWYMWLRGGKHHTPLTVRRTSVTEGTIVVAAVVTLTGVIWSILPHHPDGTPFWDALTTAISLGAQWLINRKLLESWLLWIVVDVIYVPLYLYKGLNLTALLYAVFCVMAVTGLLHWRRTWRANEAAGAA